MAQGSPVIVLVEDDDGLRGALVRMLSLCGFRTLGFATAEAARDAAPWHTAACLVVDVRLPGISGFDLIAWLRRTDRDLPFVVITAAPTLRARNQAILLGASSVLEKPIHRRALVAAIRKAIAT